MTPAHVQNLADRARVYNLAEPTIKPHVHVYYNKLEFQRTHNLCALSMYFQSTVRAAILHALHTLSSLTKAEPEMLLHTLVPVIAQEAELKHLLKHTTGTTVANSSYSSLESVVCC